MKCYFYSYIEYSKDGKMISSGWGAVAGNQESVFESVTDEVNAKRDRKDSVIHMVALNEV